MRLLSKITFCTSFILIFIVFLSPAPAEQISGRQIMTNVDERDDGDDQSSSATFQLINKRGQKRIRQTTRRWKDYDGKDGFDTKMITFFESPPDVKGTGFLNWSYEENDKDDDQWLYLPALRKVKRISASKKGDYFMGTDFTFDDMGDRKVEEDNHTLLRSETYQGKDCYVVESTPREKKYIYSKKINWIEKDNWLPLKVEYYNRKGKFLKTLTTEWQLIDNIWTWKSSVMENHQTKHKTIIDIKKPKINTGITDNVFSDRTLKRGL